MRRKEGLLCRERAQRARGAARFGAPLPHLGPPVLGGAGFNRRRVQKAWEIPEAHRPSPPGYRPRRSPRARGVPPSHSGTWPVPAGVVGASRVARGVLARTGRGSTVVVGTHKKDDETDFLKKTELFGARVRAAAGKTPDSPRIRQSPTAGPRRGEIPIPTLLSTAPRSLRVGVEAVFPFPLKAHFYVCRCM